MRKFDVTRRWLKEGEPVKSLTIKEPRQVAQRGSLSSEPPYLLTIKALAYVAHSLANLHEHVLFIYA